MAKTCLLGPWVALVAATVAAHTAFSQDFPRKPVRILASEPGGFAGTSARMIAPGVSGLLGQPVIVDHRTGIISIEIVVKAPPDGYTLFMYGSTLWLGPLLEKTSYDYVRDFAPITIPVSSPSVLVVSSSVPVNSVKELIAYAKARPGVLNYGSSAPGGPSHLGPELFKSMAGGLDIVRVQYKGSGLALNALAGGEVQMMVTSAGPAMALANAGKLKALAVTSAKPSALVPGLPTIAASGLPGYESESLVGMWAPAKTPAAIIQRLNRDIVRVLNEPDIKQRFFNTGTETVGNTPEQAAAVTRAEMVRMGKVIKDANIRIE